MKLKKQIAEHKGNLPEIEIDSETGLPKLPEGFAWRVSKSNYREGFEVQLVAKEVTRYNVFEKIFFGDRDKEEFTEYGHNFSGKYSFTEGYEKEEILTAASEIYEEVRELRNNESKGQDLVGLYPPKSIL